MLSKLLCMIFLIMTMSTNVVHYHYHYDQDTTSRHNSHKNLDACFDACMYNHVDVSSCMSGCVVKYNL